MRYFAIFLFWLNPIISFAQLNCQPNTNWKCGNNPRLDGQHSNSYQFVKVQNQAMCCQCCFYDRVSQLSQWADPYPNDWQTIFTDNFDVAALDRNYWYLMYPWGNYNSTTEFGPNICDPSLNTLQNGKLVQSSVYNPGTYPYTDANGTPVTVDGSSTKNALVQVANISSTFDIPINCRVRGNIKIIGDCSNNWPAFWLRGGQMEIDIFEFTNSPGNGSDNSYPCNYPKMSYSNTPYCVPRAIISNGPPVIVNEQPFNAQYGSNNGTEFSQGFHTFELIWDQFKIQFWIDGQIIYDDFVYFRIKNSWSNYHEKRHWRESPVKKPSDLDPLKPHYVNKYALDNLAYAMHAIIGFATLIPDANYVNGQMETEWFSFGLRADCSSGDNNVSSLNFYNGSTAYETGYHIASDPNASITVPQYKYAFFAATDEIALNPGVSIETGGVFSAQLTACESGWDARTTSGVDFNEPSENDTVVTDSTQERYSRDPDAFVIDEQDSIIYFNTLPQFDETNPFTELVNYPDHLTLTSREELIKSAEIYNMQGELIYKSSNINSNFVSIQKQSSWSTGLYIIRVYSSSTLHIHRVWIRGN